MLQPLTQNLYLYALGDPVNYKDPDGNAAKAKAPAPASNTKPTATTPTATMAGATATTTAAKAKSNTVPAGATKAPAPAKAGSSSGGGGATSTGGGGSSGGGGATSSGGGTTGSGAGSSGGGTRGGDEKVLPTIKLDMHVLEITHEMNRVFCSPLANRAVVGKFVENALREYLRTEYGLNDSEVDFVLKYPYTMPGIKVASETAIRAEVTLFRSEQDMVQQNSFKHAFWMCMLSYHIGPTLALEYGKAHEYDKDASSDKKRNSAMDLHNNQIGINIYNNRIKGGAAILAFLNEREGSSEAREAALELYNFDNTELILFRLCIDAYLEAVQVEYNNGQLISINGASIAGKLVFY